MKLWKQIRKVVIGTLSFDFEKIDLEFDVKCTDDNKADIAKIKIYNLAEATKQKLKQNLDVSITAGYEELNGVIFNGIVESIVHSREESDIVTTITATPNNRAYSNTIINMQFKAGIKASEIMRQIENLSTFKVDIKELAKDVTYPNGKVFSGRLSNVVPILAKDTGTIARFTNTTIEFKLGNKSYSTVLKLSGDNGLIRVEKKQDVAGKKDKNKKKEKEKYDIECLLVPLVKIGQLLEIESTTCFF